MQCATATTARETDIALNVPRAVIDTIARLRAPIVVAHVVPDADALGSMFATALGWTDKSRTPLVSLPPSSLSQRLKFLFDMAKVRVATEKDFAAADGFIVVDTAKQPRCNVGSALKDTDWVAGKPLVNIDHHSTNTQFGTVNWVDATACSACEMVYQMLVAANRTITPAMASLLYAGIQTDTLGFSLPTTTPEALRAAGHLVELGANVSELGERLGRSQSRGEFELLRVVYANTKTAADGRIAYSSASYDDVHNAGCTAADIDEQISVPRSLDGVVLAMLFSEGNKGKTRINFRSSGYVTVVDLAKEFGGGGHPQASGAILDSGIQEAIDKVVPRAVEHLKRFSFPRG